MANAAAQLDTKAKGIVHTLAGWLDLAILLVEKAALLLLVVILFGTIEANFNVVNFWLPKMSPQALAWTALAWALLTRRINIEKILGLTK
jgi:hypothetical protein